MPRFFALSSTVFLPKMRLIEGISQSEQAVVITTQSNSYIVGEKIRFYVSKVYGMPQIDKKVGTILEIVSPTIFVVDIDTRYFEPLIIPGTIHPHVRTYPSVVPIGEVNEILAAATRNVL